MRSVHGTSSSGTFPKEPRQLLLLMSGSSVPRFRLSGVQHCPFHARMAGGRQGCCGGPHSILPALPHQCTLHPWLPECLPCQELGFSCGPELLPGALRASLLCSEPPMTPLSSSPFPLSFLNSQNSRPQSLLSSWETEKGRPEHPVSESRTLASLPNQIPILGPSELGF